MTNSLVTVDLNSAPVDAVFGQILRRMAGKSALMREVAGIMLDEVEENFAQQGRPRWAELKSVDLRRAGYTRTKTGRMAFLKRSGRPSYMILQHTGRLASSITPSWSADSATVGTTVVYAKIHHFGGRTKPHTIRAKNGKALALPGGIFRRSVQHPGSVIPARPFMMLGPTGEARIIRAGEAFLQQAVGR